MIGSQLIAADEGADRRFVSIQLRRRGLHPADMVARIGGEEFAILLPAKTLDLAQRRLESLRKAFHEKAGWDLCPSSKIVTFSARLARCERGDTVKTLMRRADLLLYEAKKAGHDRIDVL